MNEEGKNLTSHPFEIEISLWEIARMLIRRIHWLIIAGIAAGVITFLAVTLFVTPKYESKVSFFVFNSTNTSSQTGTVNNADLQAAESLATTYSKILESNTVLDAVIEDLGGQADLSRKDLSSMLKVSVVSDTQLLEVVVTSSDAAFACDIASSFANVAPTEIVRITKAGGAEVVDKPEIAQTKSSPNKTRDCAVGALLGICIAAIIIIIKNLSDTTIYLPGDITAATDVIVIGQIPTIEPQNATIGWQLAEGGTTGHETREKGPRYSK